MGVHLRQRKGTAGKVSLYLDIYYKGKRTYEYLDISIADTKRLSKEDRSKLDLAESIRSKREYELILGTKGQGIPNKRKEKIDFWTFCLAVHEGKNQRRWKSALKALKDYTKGNPIQFSDFDTKWLLGYQAYLLSCLSNNTAFYYMWTLSYVLAEAERENLIAKNPCKLLRREDKIRLKKTLPKYLTLDELRLLFGVESKINPEIRAAFFFSCFTGLRWSDLSRLDWSQIKAIKNKDGGSYSVIELQVEKTDIPLTVPLSEQAMTILEDIPLTMREESGPVFPWCAHNPDSHSRRTRATDMLKVWAKEAGLNKNLSFHMARHTFATLTLEHGADLYTVSKLLGHKNIATTTIYAKVVDESKKRAVMNLPSL